MKQTKSMTFKSEQSWVLFLLCFESKNQTIFIGKKQPKWMIILDILNNSKGHIKCYLIVGIKRNT